MEAGLLKNRITIYKDQGTERSPRNQHVQAPEAFMTCWAGVNQQDSQDTFYAGKQTSIDVYDVVIRYQPDLIPRNQMYLVYNGYKLNVAGVVISNDKTSVYLRCINKDKEVA